MSAIPNALKAEFDAYDFLQNTFATQPLRSTLVAP